MKTTIKTMTLLILCSIGYGMGAQTDFQEQLHDKYWNYRQRYRQHFTYIGKEKGEGVPIVEINVGATVPAIKLDANNNDLPISADFKGIMGYGGDNTVYLGYQIALLSTEYHLLTTAPTIDQKALKACLHELYFCLYALERLDKNANNYFDYTQAPDNTMDGFFIRDDVQGKNVNPFLYHPYPRVEWIGGITSKGREIIPAVSDYATRKFVMSKTENGSTFNVRNKDADIKPYDAGWYTDEKTTQSALNEMSQYFAFTQ